MLRMKKRKKRELNEVRKEDWESERTSEIDGNSKERQGEEMGEEEKRKEEDSDRENGREKKKGW